MKTISIKNPYGYLICANIKPIENRTWPTSFRGRVLVHVSAKAIPMINPNNVFSYQQWESLSTDQKVHLMGGYMPTSAIIGSVEIVDCVINHPSIWAEKSEMTIGALSMGVKPIYNWVLKNPIMFPEPIPAKGKLSFWDYTNILAEPEEENGELFCHCRIPVDEKSQVAGDSRFGDYCRYCRGRWYK